MPKARNRASASSFKDASIRILTVAVFVDIIYHLSNISMQLYYNCMTFASKPIYSQSSKKPEENLLRFILPISVKLFLVRNFAVDFQEFRFEFSFDLRKFMFRRRAFRSAFVLDLDNFFQGRNKGTVGLLESFDIY